MNFRKRKERLDYLLEMIEKGKCVSLIQVANKFNCSSKTVERMINKLRENGHNIKYCRKSVRYKLIDKKISSIA
ncbi:MAG: DeoR family transcriptional regulator [Flavobacteriales bacterium]